jgi:hypothetical protein
MEFVMRSVPQCDNAISKAELEPEIPAHAEDDDFLVEMAAFEKIINARHFGWLPPKARS